MSRTVIANPIYDSVFKYLMEDIPAARVLLSALLQRKIGEIELKRNEYTRTKTKDEISVLRVDFAAEIFNDDGSRELVTIEIQKTYLSTEIMRFRRYLAAHYSDETNAIVLSDRPNRKRALHIITIYLLGHEVEELDNAVTYVYPRMYDQNMNKIDKKVNEVEFVDGLVHDMIVVQIPKITSAKVVSHLDRILSVFDQRNIVPSCQRELTVDDSTYTDDADIDRIVRRLQKAASDEDVRKEMEIMDEYQTLYDNYVKERTDQQNKIKEQMEQLDAQMKQLEEKDNQLAAKDNQLAQQETQLAQQETQLAALNSVISSAVSAFAASGKSAEEIATLLNIPLDVVLKVTKE